MGLTCQRQTPLEGVLSDQLVIQLIVNKRPDRILLSDGIGYSPARVPDEVMRTMNKIFVRDDGWSLGCTPASEAEAYTMWRDRWVGFIANNTYKQMSEYEIV